MIKENIQKFKIKSLIFFSLLIKANIYSRGFVKKKKKLKKPEQKRNYYNLKNYSLC